MQIKQERKQELRLGLLFARYVPLASQSPYPIILYSVANYRNKLWNCTYFRHPTDEQLRHVDILFSNYYNLQSVHFE